MGFKDFTEFIQPPLALPFNGKVYTIPKPSIEVGLRLTRGITEGEGSDLYASDVEEQWKLVLGSAYDEMVADKVPVEFVTRAFLTALADFQTGREMAEVTWEAGLDPEAVAALLTQRIQARAAQDEASSSTDEATTTP